MRAGAAGVAHAEASVRLGGGAHLGTVEERPYVEARVGGYARAQVRDEAVASGVAGVGVQTVRADHGVPAVDDEQFGVRRHPLRVARGGKSEGEVALEALACAVLAREFLFETGHLGLELAHVRDPRIAEDVV